MAQELAVIVLSFLYGWRCGADRNYYALLVMLAMLGINAAILAR